MKILMLRGAPRKKGLTNKLADLFAKGVAKTDSELWDINLCKWKIAPCLGCFACAGAQKKCVQRDDMDILIEKISECDAVVCFSPVYFYSMSSQLKLFFDRCFPFVCGYEYQKDSGELVNRTSFKINNKKLLTVSVASGRLSGSFSAISETYTSIAKSLSFEYVADIKRGESPFFMGELSKSLRLKKIFQAYSNIGEEFALRGEIAPQTLANAELEIAQSDEDFAKKARIFWQMHQDDRFKCNL